jgi:hypothetical protein
MATIGKIDWYGGINQLPDRSKIDFATEYGLLINGRVRTNEVTPVIGPLDITSGLPTTAEKQGLYAFGSLLLAFAGGKAYYKETTATIPSWIPVVGLQLSTTANIEAVAIPASSINYKRFATDATDIKSPVRLQDSRNASPAAVLVTDGINQPWFIFADGSARVTKTYAQWTIDDPEYIPIHRMPYMSPDGILYCIGKDLNGVYNQIYRSVTGSPANFVIVVNTLGNKSGSEAQGGAPALAERASFSPITFIGGINSVDGSFLVTTATSSTVFTPDYTRLICSEPTYIKQYLFDVGAVNENSVANVLGDTTVISSRGIRSFNGVQQLKFKGEFSPFNINVNRIFGDIVQTTTAATTFDNYAVYAVQTIYGYGILWYDMLLAKWVSLDLYDNQSAIVQFASVTVGALNELYFLTESGSIFQCFAGDVQKCTVYLADLMPKNPSYRHSMDAIAVTFSGGGTDGFCAIGTYANGKYTGAVTLDLPAENIAPTGGVEPVTGQLVVGEESTVPLVFSLKQISELGTRLGTSISWNTDASLLSLALETDETGPTNVKAVQTNYVEAQKIILLGYDGVSNPSQASVNLLIQKENPDYIIGLGSHTSNGTASSVVAYLKAHWNNQHEKGTFYAIPGPSELDTSVGEPFFQYVLQAPSRYSILPLAAANFYLLNAGIDSSGGQVEPDNTDGSALAMSTQALWLDTQVRNNRAKFNFVLLGTPPRSSVSGLASADWNEVDYAGIGVDGVFSGQGAYERIEDSRRVVFINSGTGGKTLQTFGTARLDSAVRISSFGYTRITLTPLSALIEFVSIDGEVLDRRLL